MYVPIDFSANIGSQLARYFLELDLIRSFIWCWHGRVENVNFFLKERCYPFVVRPLKFMVYLD